MRFRMMARRAAISLFLIVHLTAVATWNLPAGELRARAIPIAQYYILPTGLWQYWGMFAPDPVKETLTVEAMALDSKGKIYRYPFPKVADYSFLGSIPRVRVSKFNNLMADKMVPIHREIAARHAVRQMNIDSAAFPVHVELNFLYWTSPPVGAPPTDPMTPPQQVMISAYRYPSLSEVLP